MKRIIIYLMLVMLSINMSYAGEQGGECPSVSAIKMRKFTEFKYIPSDMWAVSSSDTYDTSFTWHFDMMIPNRYSEEETHQQASLGIVTLQFINGPETLPDKNKWCFYQTSLGKAYAHRPVRS